MFTLAVAVFKRRHRLVVMKLDPPSNNATQLCLLPLLSMTLTTAVANTLCVLLFDIVQWTAEFDEMVLIGVSDSGKIILSLPCEIGCSEVSI